MTLEQQNATEQDKIKELMASDGAKILFNKLQTVANKARESERRYDPYLFPHKIMKARLTDYIINELIVQLIEGIVNYDPDAIDNQVTPKEKWSFWKWLKG